MQKPCDYLPNSETGFAFHTLSHGEARPHCYTGRE
jgi:hypothetical protein